MVNQLKLIVLFSNILLLASCSWRQSFAFDSALRRKYNPTKINTTTYFLDTGFFISKKNSKYYNTIILYPDGLANFDSNEKDSTMMKDYLEKLVIKDIPLKWGNWGYYDLVSDTLTLVTQLSPGGMSNYSIKLKFKLTNNKELILITKETSFDEALSLDFNNNQENSVFVEVKQLPSTNPWLKQKRWFWADKKDYRAYRKELRNK